MSADGKDTADNTKSTSSFISALVMGLVVLSALLAVWFVLRKRDRRIFQPRTILPPEGKRAPVLPDAPIAWFKTVFTAPDKLILTTNGPDAYLFIRFIRLSALIFAVFFVVTWVILMPVAGTGGGGLTGLNQFTFGNITKNQQPRIIAHFLVAILLTFYVLYLVDLEYKHYRETRQAWLSDESRTDPATRTVVIFNVPSSLMTTSTITEFASAYGAVDKVWLGRIAKDLEDVYDERNKEVGKLENAEGSVLALAAKNVKKNKLPDPTKAASIESDELISKYIPKKKQPSHKRGFLGLLGKKVDTLNESPAYIQEKEAVLKTAREGADSLPMGDTAFVRFQTRHQAHVFARDLGRKEATFKNLKSEIEVMPEDVVWENLKMSPSMRRINGIISWALTIGLIIIWAIPVAFVGFVSNINSLTSTVKFLSFLKGLPSVVLGIIQGILPPVLLAVLFMLLPIVLRKFVKMSGLVLRSDIELQLFSRFWLFQVIHGFLIVTLASGLINALKNIGSTLPQLPTLLAQKLPTASTFFLQWLTLYALTSFGLSVSRVVPFILNKLGGILSGPTPRKTFKFGDKMLSIALATTWPPVALLMCVGVVYSCIQPIITLFGLFTFSVLYIMYKYILIWCADQPSSLETGGEYMRKALVTVFVSLYIELICLCGLFFLSPGPTGRSKPGYAGGALMAVMIVLVAVFHWTSTHKRYPARDCHFIEGALLASKTNESKVAMMPEGDHSYPPTSKETDNLVARPNATAYNEHAFDHPATWKPMPVVWIADDTLGIGRAETARLNELLVPASTEFATMDADGKIDVSRTAPDEDWVDGIKHI